jgi:hypothetical protein
MKGILVWHCFTNTKSVHTILVGIIILTFTYKLFCLNHPYNFTLQTSITPKPFAIYEWYIFKKKMS